MPSSSISFIIHLFSHAFSLFYFWISRLANQEYTADELHGVGVCFDARERVEQLHACLRVQVNDALVRQQLQQLRAPALVRQLAEFFCKTATRGERERKREREREREIKGSEGGRSIKEQNITAMCVVPLAASPKATTEQKNNNKTLGMVCFFLCIPHVLSFPSLYFFLVKATETHPTACGRYECSAHD